MADEEISYTEPSNVITPQASQIEKKTYPSAPDQEGFYFENEEEEEAGVQTKVYDNGSVTKRARLRNGKMAVARSLRGREMIEIRRRMENDKGMDIQTVAASESLTIDGRKMPPEYYLDDLFMPDYIRTVGMSNLLNF